MFCMNCLASTPNHFGEGIWSPHFYSQTEAQRDTFCPERYACDFSFCCALQLWAILVQVRVGGEGFNEWVCTTDTREQAGVAGTLPAALTTSTLVPDPAVPQLQELFQSILGSLPQEAGGHLRETEGPPRRGRQQPRQQTPAMRLWLTEQVCRQPQLCHLHPHAIQRSIPGPQLCPLPVQEGPAGESRRGGASVGHRGQVAFLTFPI